MIKTIELNFEDKTTRLRLTHLFENNTNLQFDIEKMKEEINCNVFNEEGHMHNDISLFYIDKWGSGDELTVTACINDSLEQTYIDKIHEYFENACAA